MSANLQLDRRASAMLGRFQHQVGSIPSAAEQKIAQACEASATPLDAEQLWKLLREAMPQQKAALDRAKAICLSHQVDGTNPSFLTQILSHRIEKVTERARVGPRQQLGSRDPLYGEFLMSPKASAMLLFNARDVDDKGNPLLMKVVLREGAKLEDIDLSPYRTKWSQPDVRVVAEDADYVTTADRNETEFAFGDPLLAVSVDHNGGEMSRAISTKPENTQVTEYPTLDPTTRRRTGNWRPTERTTGHQLDKTEVATFMEKVDTSMKRTSDADLGAWVDAPLSDFAAEISVGRGFMFEPGANAKFGWARGAADSWPLPPAALDVPRDDAALLGSAPTSHSLETQNLGGTLAGFLNGVVLVHTQANGGDLRSKKVSVRDLVYRDTAKVRLGGRGVKPASGAVYDRHSLAELGVKAVKRPISPSGQRVDIDVPAGFLTGGSGVSPKGWTIVAGHTDGEGQWVTDETIEVDAKKSQARCLSFEVPDAAGAHRRNTTFELRVFDARGLPVEALKIPIRGLGWAG